MGAMDGITNAIGKPQDATNQASFYNFKGFYAIPVQDIVDTKYIFIFFSANCVG